MSPPHACIPAIGSAEMPTPFLLLLLHFDDHSVLLPDCIPRNAVENDDKCQGDQVLYTEQKQGVRLISFVRPDFLTRACPIDFAVPE